MSIEEKNYVKNKKKQNIKGDLFFMKKRLEIEIDDDTYYGIYKYARKKGMRLPFIYGKILAAGLEKVLDDDLWILREE